MFRGIVALACFVSGIGMMLVLAAFVIIAVAAGSLRDQTVAIGSWQARLVLGAVAMLVLPLPIIVIGFFTLACPRCRTSLLDPTRVPLTPPLAWVPSGRMLELSWRLAHRQTQCLNCGAPL